LGAETEESGAQDQCGLYRETLSKRKKKNGAEYRTIEGRICKGKTRG
jgi:hypothetical protein